ncbi:hypothetical protein H632_c1935p0 [Helicosporidium sp. ATCC 50920]|nr:hypothetical protein H632_c1935p0 [Helicosporidium sp. ATCC 50920]|eukprot:KDD73678.1 hypothetical protein H632_c1935p0 [Helicosporidium sp. ATCC 50920]
MKSGVRQWLTNPQLRNHARSAHLKTTNLDEMKIRVRYVAEDLDQLLDFNKRLPNPRFRREGFCHQKIDEIINCLAVAGKDTVVYMGDYGNDNRDGRLKGLSSGPVKEITSHNIRERGVECQTGFPPFPFQRECCRGELLSMSNSAVDELPIRQSP